MKSNFERSRSSCVVAAATILLFAATGCSSSSSAPSDQEIESKVGAYLAATSDIWDVKNIHKTNGTRKDDGTYVADVTYDVVFKHSFAGTMGLEQKAHGDMEATQIMQPLMQRYGMWDKGKTGHEEESFSFVKSEKGWVIPKDE